MIQLPEDMIIEILSILPVKSLLRFRCVCKPWYTLVKSNSFISKHLKNDHNIHLVVNYYEHTWDELYGNITHGEFAWFTDEKLTESSLQNFMPQLPLSQCQLKICDGILYDRTDDGYLLYNIATKDLRTLPRSEDTPLYMNRIEGVGFGLDPLSNSYKLVLIKHTIFDRSCPPVFGMQVFTLNSDHAWRSVKGSNISNIEQCNFYLDDFCGSCLNGVCYWLTSLYDTIEDKAKDVIFSFHLGDEMPQEIMKLPGQHCVTPGADGFSRLRRYDDSLGLLRLDRSTQCVDMWVMNNRGCWTKQYSTVGPFVNVTSPFGFWKRDSFFVRSTDHDIRDVDMRDKLLLYDPNSTQNTKCRCVFTGYIPDISIYKESLVNIKGDDHFF